MASITPSEQVGTVVAHDARTAAVFHRHGIDFCCGGRQTIGDACRTHALDADAIIAELGSVNDTPGAPLDQTTQSISLLIDHIVTTHHRYVRQQTVVISGYLAKLLDKHGSSQATLSQLSTAFAAMSRDLTVHMMKEERILFPYMRALDEAAREGDAAPAAPFGTVANPIRMMEAEHRRAGDEMLALRTLTNGYLPPETACTTWKVCYTALEAFERDLEQHVHLENNVLFPAVLALG